MSIFQAWPLLHLHHVPSARGHPSQIGVLIADPDTCHGMQLHESSFCPWEGAGGDDWAFSGVPVINAEWCIYGY